MALSAGTPIDFDTNVVIPFAFVKVAASKGLVAYEDVDAGGDAEAAVITLSGTTLTAGTPAALGATSITDIDAAYLDTDKAIVGFADNSDSNKGKAQVLSISGSTITPGTAATYESTANTRETAIAAPSSTLAVVFYRIVAGNTYGCKLAVSGTTVTPATPVSMATAEVVIAACALDSSRVLLFTEGPSNAVRFRVVDVSGTLSFGSSSDVGGGATVAATYTNARGCLTLVAADKVVAVYHNGSNAYAVVVNTSGSTISSFGTPLLLSLQADPSVDKIKSDKVLVSALGYVESVSISGSTLTKDGDNITWGSSPTGHDNVKILEDTKAVIAYSGSGKAVLITGVPTGAAASPFELCHSQLGIPGLIKV